MSLPWSTALILVTSALFVLHLSCAVGGTPPGKISKDAPPSGLPQQNNKAPLVGAYYYNWYNIEDQWKKYPRAHEPTLGEYDIKEHDFAIEKHHSWAKEAGVDFFAMLWTGSGSSLVNWPRADEIDDRIASHLQVKDGVKVSLVYNIRELVESTEYGLIDFAEGENCQIFHDHMLHAARTHFKKDDYLKIYGSPVIFLHTLRDYVNHKECLKVTFEQVQEEIGTWPYLVGDSIWWSPSAKNMPWKDFGHFNLSALTAVNLVDHSQPSKMDSSFAFYSAELYHELLPNAWKDNINVIPMILPGYDDSKLRGDDQVVIARAGGAEMVHQWKQTEWYTKCQPFLMSAMNWAYKYLGKTQHQQIVMINSWNEWHEGSEIEPSTEYGRQYIELLSALKAEVKSDDLQCGKEKDSKFKAPKMSLPKMFLKGEMTSGDRVIVILLHFFLWAFAVSSTWVVLGGSIIKYTGRRPRKVKVDDPLEAGPVGGGKQRKHRNRMSLWTWMVILFICYGSWWVVSWLMKTRKVQGFFEDRLSEYNRLHTHNLRVAREISHKLCPGLTKAMHTPKIDAWVNKLAEGQVSQADFQFEVCGENPLHYREIVQAYLDSTGKEPEAEALTKLADQVEKGEKSLPEVISSIENSPEAADWAQQRQMNRIKLPKAHQQIVNSFKQLLEKAKEGATTDKRENQVEALQMVEAKAEALRASGDEKGAAEVIAQFFDSESKAPSAQRKRGPRGRALAAKKAPR